MLSIAGPYFVQALSPGEIGIDAPTMRRPAFDPRRQNDDGWCNLVSLCLANETCVATLPEQCVYITGLPGGTYQLRVTLDPDSLLQEANRSNNAVTMTISIPGNTVTVVKTPQTP